MRRNISVLLLLLICVSSKGQDISSFTPHDYSIIPPSPEVSALMKYIDIPVSPFTGQPDITLPLYTVKEGSLEVPISISYHGGGIKLNEHAGIVGLGWNLNAGGCVSRTIHGLPDELNKGGQYGLHGLYHLKETDTYLRQNILNRNVNNIYSPDLFTGVSESHILSELYCNDYNDGKSDMANDIMHFSFMGMSGTFIINSDAMHTLTMNTHSPVAVELGNSVTIPETGGSIVFYDDLHNRYYFNEEEQTRFNYTYNSGGSLKTDSIYCGSAWHLTRIVSPGGDTIRFEYVSAGHKRYYLGYSAKKTTITPRFSDYGPTTSFSTSPHEVEYNAKALKRIKSRSAIIEFDYNNDYSRLTGFSVCRNEPNHETVKKYSLTYTHINGSNDVNYLDSINEQNVNANTTIRLYKFIYNDSFYGLGSDRWGFRTNEGGNGIVLDDNYRMPDENYGKYGILERIIYAGGGVTLFDWEQNDYSYIGNLPVTHQNNQNYITTKRRLYGGNVTDWSQLTQENVESSMFDNLYSINLPRSDSRATITIDLTTFMTSLMNGNGSALDRDYCEYYYCHGTGDQNSDAPRVELRDPNNNLINYWFIDNCQCQGATINTQILGSQSTGAYTIKLRYPYNWRKNYATLDTAYISPQEIYNLLVPGAPDNGSGGNGYIDITVVQPDENNSSFKKPWGGYRIASIEHNSGQYDPIVKEFTYLDESDSRYSSGTILEEPYYFSKSYSCSAYLPTSGMQVVQNWSTIENYHSEGLYSTPNGANHVEYPYVREQFRNDSLQIDYEFTSQRSYNIDFVKEALFYDHIYGGARINTSIDHKTGNLLSKVYSINNRKVKQECFDCNIIEGASPTFCGDFFKITDVEGMHTSTGSGSNDCYSSDYTTCRYRLMPYNKQIQSIHAREYDNYQNNTYYETATGYTYFTNAYNSEPSASFIRSERRLDSDGDSTTTFYTYRTYQDGDHTYYLNLREAEVTVKNGNVISGRRNVYDSCNRLIGTYRCRTGIPFSQLGMQNYYYSTPTAVYAAMNVPEYTYQYDNDGNLVEISYNGTVLASYLWGYKGSHPIAEIKGVSYTELCTSLPQLLQPSALLNRYDLTESDLNTIRTTFAGHDVTTLTYNWLIGAGTMTDPRGVTTRFTYDGYGRLDSVKDFNDYLIKKYQYHYANQ